MDALAGLSDEKLKAAVLARDEDERTLFHRACANGRDEEVRLFLDRLSEDVARQCCTSCDDGQWTPLHSAVSAGHVVIGKAIIPFSDVNAENGFGATPLHYAASKGRVELAQALLAANANVDKADQSGSNSLHRCVAQGRREVVSVIIEQLGAMKKGSAELVINRRDKTGSTPLHLASYGGFHEIGMALLEAGADPTIKDKEEKMPIDYAPDKKMEEMLERMNG